LAQEYLRKFAHKMLVKLTTESFGLRRFTFDYAPREIQYPGQMQTIQLRPDYTMVSLVTHVLHYTSHFCKIKI
jgi:hypothetical protein